MKYFLSKTDHETYSIENLAKDRKTLGVLSPLPRAGALRMAVVAGTIDLYLGAAWSAAVDIGGRSGGAVPA
jgi:hypothetical protein